jgi:hypothetical protein
MMSGMLKPKSIYVSTWRFDCIELSAQWNAELIKLKRTSGRTFDYCLLCLLLAPLFLTSLHFCSSWTLNYYHVVKFIAQKGDIDNETFIFSGRFQLSEQFRMTFLVVQNVSNKIALKACVRYARIEAETKLGETSSVDPISDWATNQP